MCKYSVVVCKKTIPLTAPLDVALAVGHELVLRGLDRVAGLLAGRDDVHLEPHQAQALFILVYFICDHWYIM
jgi:hypothetical protein